MPYITIKMLTGRDDQKKQKLIAKVTEAVVDALDVPEENVVIFIEELEKNHLGVGGKPKQ